MSFKFNTNATQSTVVFLMGATASGKTDLAINLCRRFPFDIISVDATQVYRGLDIGTAKPCAEILKQFPHRLINNCDPQERYSAGRFVEDASKEIQNSLSNGRIPLLVGGTMFYFHALTKGLSPLPRASESIGAKIQERASQIGWPALHGVLTEIDPGTASRVDPNDSQRIQRMLEVYYMEGKTAGSFMHDSPPKSMPYRRVSMVVSGGDRDLLRSRIVTRFKQMLQRGFIDEARQLYERPDLDSSMPSMKSAGYKQAWDYFDGQIDYDTMVDKSILATSAIAKRQLTWLRNTSAQVWVDGSKPTALNLITSYFEARKDLELN